MNYCYFFSGILFPNNYSHSYFNGEITLPKEISSYEDISFLRKKFAASEKIDPENVLILNYQLLRTEREE